MTSPRTIAISRTDNLGDVVLTLPLAGILKERFPGVQILFIGKRYTRAVVECCPDVDVFLEVEALLEKPGELGKYHADVVLHVFPNKQVARMASNAGIPLRIGTAHRLFHWFYCNRLVRFTRRRSDWHEAQLNTRLLLPLGIREWFSVEKLAGYLSFNAQVQVLTDSLPAGKSRVIVHPKSKGSAREWPLAHYNALIRLMPKDRFQVYVTGTKEEGERIRAEDSHFFDHGSITDMTGKLSLGQLISFIAQSDALVACSTGPLHLAAALGIKSIGIFPPIKPMDPARWAPLGKKVHILVKPKNCNLCRKSASCECIASVTPEQVLQIIEDR